MFAGRPYWLGRPWFLAAGALLVVNDHVLKAAWPGVVTGKLSDVAGLIVVGTLLSVVLGRSWGIAVGALAFAALKTVPGVAEVVAPLLGGVTLRDPSDLVALAALLFVWRLLGTPVPASRTRRTRAIALVGLVVALFGTTATAAPPDRLEWLGFVDGAFFAEAVLQPTGTESTRTVWVTSTDGGVTWSKAEAPSATPQPQRVSEGPMIRGTQACADDGVCFRSIQVSTQVPGRNTEITSQIDRRLPGEDWVTESARGGDCIIAINPADSDQVLTVNAYRAGPGDWRTLRLLDIARALFG